MMKVMHFPAARSSMQQACQASDNDIVPGPGAGGGHLLQSYCCSAGCRLPRVGANAGCADLLQADIDTDTVARALQGWKLDTAALATADTADEMPQTNNTINALLPD